MSTAYQWCPIADLDGDPKDLTDGELIPLGRVWATRKKELIETGELTEFEKRLRREWAVETGIIENVYMLDRGTTRTLIVKGIDAALIPHDATNRDATLVARIIQDHYDALEIMFDFVGGQRQLSTSYVKELHAALLRNQDTHTVVDQFGRAFEKRLEKGQYKVEPNSPTRPDGTVHEYCPPEHVAAEMDRLVEMHREHETRRVAPEVEAAWLHHRFTQIHPFADGNGRVARAMASLVFIKADWFPLTIQREDWERYVEALERADYGDLRPLVAMFVEAQRNALIQATEVAHDVRPVSTEEEAIAALRERLVHRGMLDPREWEIAKETAAKLIQSAVRRLEQTASHLEQEIGNVFQGFTFLVEGANEETETALRLFGPAGYPRRVQIKLNAGRSDALVLSFDGTGPRYRGIISVAAFLEPQGAKPVTLEGGTFQINYEEDLASAQSRFAPWLDRMIVEGLNQWRRRL